mmetsp:Transcript_34555/g.99173  ORF Transcript_34555/g.99173 Transcript_34555/m.99173 type:complete len:357 (+) Transcript_34555:816-1886(+)
MPCVHGRLEVHLPVDLGTPHGPDAKPPEVPHHDALAPAHGASRQASLRGHGPAVLLEVAAVLRADDLGRARCVLEAKDTQAPSWQTIFRRLYPSPPHARVVDSPLHLHLDEASVPLKALAQLCIAPLQRHRVDADNALVFDGLAAGLRQPLRRGRPGEGLAAPGGRTASFQGLRVHRSDVPCSELAVWEPVELGLHLPAFHLLQPPVVSTGLHLLLELLRVRDLHGPQVCGQLVLPPHDLAPVLALDDTIARRADSCDCARDLLPQGLALLRAVALVLVVRNLALHHPLCRRRMPRTEVLHHPGAGLDGVALQPLTCGVRRLLIAVPEDDRPCDGGDLLCLCSSRAQGDLSERQEL